MLGDHDMGPAEGEPRQEIDAPASRTVGSQPWAARIRADAQRLAQRAQIERGRHRSIDAVFEMAERDGDVGGGIIAGALAYRLFIWLLPVALIAVAGLGFAADASSESPDDAARSLGLEGLISSSIANAANSPNRWYALLIGIPVLIWATRSVLRVLIGAHRLVWTDDRTAAPKPKLAASLRLLALFVCLGVVSAAASALRAWSTGPGAVATLLALVPYAGLWLLVTFRLPHRDAPWTALIPGAAVFALGLELLPCRHRLRHHALGAREAGNVRSFGSRGRAARRPLPDQQADRRRRSC
jgi:uncharacterized BrkB/YihY/UPF0761 family membrane protein